MTLTTRDRIGKLDHMAPPTDGTDNVALTAKIRDLLSARSPSSSICPSDVARAVKPDDWRPLMEPVRAAARAMMAEGEVQITQGGEVVADPDDVRGPIRIRWTR
jgi:hypothetical protein